MGTYKSVPEIRLSGNIRGTETIVTVKIWGLLLDITERNKSCRDSTKKWDERVEQIQVLETLWFDQNNLIDYLINSTKFISPVNFNKVINQKLSMAFK